MNHAPLAPQTCIRCGVDLPRTEAENALISSRFGWRLTRRQTDDGVVTLEWHCAECWQKEKQAAAATRAATGSATAGGWPLEAAEQPPSSNARSVPGSGPRASAKSSGVPRLTTRRGG